MLEIKVTIESTSLAEAINNLATAMAGKGAQLSTIALATPVQEVKQTAPVTPAPQVQAPVASTSVPQVQAPVAPTPAPQAQAPAAPAPQPQTAPTPVAPQLQAPQPITLESISRAGAALVDQGKMQQIMGLLAKYGVQAITQLDASLYGNFAADLRALGAAI